MTRLRNIGLSVNANGTQQFGWKELFTLSTSGSKLTDFTALANKTAATLNTEIENGSVIDLATLFRSEINEACFCFYGGTNASDGQTCGLQLFGLRGNGPFDYIGDFTLTAGTLTATIDLDEETLSGTNLWIDSITANTSGTNWKDINVVSGDISQIAKITVDLAGVRYLVPVVYSGGFSYLTGLITGI